MQPRTTPRAGPTARTGQRGLSTARAALQVAWLLAGRPDGVRADEVAETLGKSVSTAYNLLASLAEEGVAEHHSAGCTA
jgi:DNA-binding IclR family transcriptional regulator